MINNYVLHEMFREQAKKTPNAMALVDGATRLTYLQTDEHSDELAAQLIEMGVERGDRVGVFMETSAEYAVSCIAALKAGAAFIPVGPNFPGNLLANIWKEAEPKAVIAKTRHLSGLPDSNGVQYLVVDLLIGCDRKNAIRVGPEVNQEDLAFVPYTSGTTGQPKGVMQTHGAAVNSYLSRYRFSLYQVGDRVGCNIFFIWEFLRPLLRGATCFVIPDEVICVPRMILKFIGEHRIREILFTPSLLESIIKSEEEEKLRESLKTLKVLWLNGEVVAGSLVHRLSGLLPGDARVFNTYSVSECHDIATLELHNARDLETELCPVGSPVNGVIAGVMPEDGMSLQVTGLGELYVAGFGLAKGYLAREDLTSERFPTVEGLRYYRTGDIAEIDTSGSITVRGRCDSMVKIRGYSVYLAGIEETLKNHCGAKEAVVLLKGQIDHNQHMVAYVTRGPGAAWRVDPISGVSRDLRALLRRHLPAYMVPTRYRELESIPIDPRTGKMDRTLLASLTPSSRAAVFRDSLPGAAGNSREERRRVMKLIWSQVLDLDLDVNDVMEDWDFFELGGHSLLGVELTLAIEEVFRMKLSGSEVYSYPTVNQLVDFLFDGEAHQHNHLQFRDDSVLDSKITVPQGDYPDRLQNASSIFVTGTTGFLGAFLLHELLHSTAEHVKVYCLVRDKDVRSKSPGSRVLNTQQYYGLANERVAHRVVPVVGDLSEERFGLDQDAYNELAGKVDFIFHCAAAVNYVFPYSALKPHTVDGTLEVLRFAGQGRTKPLHYVSSNGVFPGGDLNPYMEDRCLDQYAERLTGGYNQSKWVAEQLVWSAKDRGLPVCIYRPGNIGHHSATGVTNPGDFQTIILYSCLRTDSAPQAHHWFFEMTPVDFLTGVIRRFADDPSHWGKVYHIVQPSPLPANDVFGFLKDSGHVSRLLSLEDWKAELSRHADDFNDRDLAMLARSLVSLEGYLTDTSVYDCTSFNQALSRAEINRPVVDVSYVTKFLAVPQAGK